MNRSAVITSASLADADVFGDTRSVSLAQMAVRLSQEEMPAKTLADTLSALRVLTERAKLDLATPATAVAVRPLLEALTAQALGVTPKRLANIRSLITRAVEQYGSPRSWITRSIRPAPEWEELLAKVPKREYAWSLSRLACYCTVKGLRPEDVSPETLVGLKTALEGECVSRKPRTILKQTIAIWNICAREASGWPPIKLASPTKPEPFMLPLSAFPESFQADVAAWKAHVTQGDVFDGPEPLRPDTVAGYLFTFRRVASALVRHDVLPIEAITELRVLAEPVTLKKALRTFMPAGARQSGYVRRMAGQFRAVAEHYLKMDSSQVAVIAKSAYNVSPDKKKKRTMGRRNFERLKPFDDRAVVQRLWRFSDEELARALRLKNPSRRAKGVERALLISILLSIGLRAKTLRSLRLDVHVERRDNRTFLSLADSDMKNHVPLYLELPPKPAALLDLFVAEHRSAIPGSDGPYLFPSPDGGPRSYSGIRDAVSNTIRKHAGIEISPHLFRHIIAKTAIELDRRSINDVSRMLGHESLNSTYEAYLGTEGPAASRRVNQLLQESMNAQPEER